MTLTMMMRKCYSVIRSSIDENNYSISRSWVELRIWLCAPNTISAVPDDKRGTLRIKTFLFPTAANGKFVL